MGDSGLGAVSQGASGATAAGNGYAQGIAQRSSGRYQERISKINAQMSELQAQDARSRGTFEASQAKGRGGRLASDQRVAFARGGADVNSGTAAVVQGASKAVSQLDALTISHNAALEAIGYNMQGINATAQGKFAAIAGRNNEVQSIATGGAKFADSITQGLMNYNKYKMRVPVEPTLDSELSGGGMGSMGETNLALGGTEVIPE